MIKIERLKKKAPVYDITVKDNHNFYGNNILVHNCLEISVPIMPIYDIINIKRAIYFKTEENKVEYYKLRSELLFNSTDKKELRRIVRKMTNFYSFDEYNLDSIKSFDYFDLDGYVNPSEIGVCILAGVNLGMVTDERLPVVMDLLVRLLEELIDMNEYDLTETEKAAKMRRTIGIGFSDVFHDLARNKVFYNTTEGRQFISDRVELATYSGIKTSIELAKERGACVLVSDTKYADGIVPLDYSADTVDSLLETRSKQDWDSVRKDLLVYGIRHSTLFANAPYGSSSVVSNATPGLEPPRELVGIKSGVPKLVPEIKKFGKYYTTAWGEDFNNIDYFKFVAICQKWMDQTISTNQYTNLMKYAGKKIPLKVLAQEMLTLRLYGGKTAYYQNTRSTDQADGLEEEVDDGCAGGGCKI